MTKIFKTPFAAQGDRNAVPVESQADGSVSYTQGYGYDYERDQTTDPAAKDIEREKMNALFHDITEALGEVQAFGAPVWNEDGKPYAIRSIVYYGKKAWQSKIENNNITPAAGTAWAELKADMTAADVGAYSKTESDKKYQPKGNYAPAGNYAVKGESYTKSEGDQRYQAAGNYQGAGYSYSKAESNNRYQPKGEAINKNTANKTANGWWRCGDTGIIFQSMHSTFKEWGDVTINFPRSFPGACINVVVSINSRTLSPSQYVLYVRGWNNSSVTVYSGGIESGALNIIAMGY